METPARVADQPASRVTKILTGASIAASRKSGDVRPAATV
jgi:hypothetical protein